MQFNESNDVCSRAKKKFNDRPACVNQKKLKDFANGLGSD